MSSATGIRLLYCEMERPGNLAPYPPEQHYGRCRHKALPGERDNATNNARCTQARKTTHGLGGQHEDVDRTLRGRVNQNDRGQRQIENVRPWCGKFSDRGRLKNITEPKTWFLRPTRVHLPNGTSIGSPVFVRLTLCPTYTETDRHNDTHMDTHTHTDHGAPVTIGRTSRGYIGLRILYCRQATMA